MWVARSYVKVVSHPAASPPAAAHRVPAAILSAPSPGAYSRYRCTLANTLAWLMARLKSQ